MHTNNASHAKTGKGTHAGHHKAIEQTAAKAPPLADTRATETQDGIDQMSDILNDVADTLAENGKQMAEAYRRFSEFGLSQVRKSPAASLLMAAVVGYGLGKLFDSRT